MDHLMFLSTRILQHDLTQKVCVLDNLPAGMNNSAVGYEFHVNESTIYLKCL
jgi:hypothetical protein